MKMVMIVVQAEGPDGEEYIADFPSEGRAQKAIRGLLARGYVNPGLDMVEVEIQEKEEIQ